jgi:AcrR family transcriptional regulator
MAAGKPVVKGEARESILNTAEELFAQQGVDAVSLRNINAAAGVSPGVLHYHFGSREVLVLELISRHMSGLMAERERMLKDLMAQAQPRVRDIMSALVRPLARLALDGEAGGARYVRFIARLYSDRSPLLEEYSERHRDINRYYSELLQRALPKESRAALDLKMAMANHAMLQTLSDLTASDRPWLSGALQQVEKNQLIEMLVDFMTNGIIGSTPERDKEL